jgi:hypothetical protein
MLIEKVPDLANLVAASTFFGQFLADRPFSILLAMAGVVAFSILTVSAFLIAKVE